MSMSWANEQWDQRWDVKKKRKKKGGGINGEDEGKKGCAMD